jgi:hypothetical protein
MKGIISCLARAADREEGLALIANTRAVLRDSRVSEAVLRHSHFEEMERKDDEGDVVFILRSWRQLLPGKDSLDLVDMRVEFGWTYAECSCIAHLLEEVMRDLTTQADKATLTGTAETQRRNADTINDLHLAWVDLFKVAYHRF